MTNEQERQIDFILHGVINLQKSLDSAKTGEDSDSTMPPRRLIWGEITNSNADEDDERLISKALDWSYFDDKGWIKYEHVANDPARIIGCPHERVTTAEGGTLIKGALFPDGKYSNDVWELIKNIEAHNRQFPDKQKTLGWSIEGHYTDGKVTKGGYRKAKVVNVVITPSPVNKSVYLHSLKENHTAFAKSLNYGDEVTKAMTATPTSTDVAQKTGGDAIAKENVDTKVKETAESLDGAAGSEDEPRKKKKSKSIKKSTTGSKSMKTFETVVQATQHFVDEGHDEETAGKLAKSLFPEEQESGGSSEGGGEEAVAGEEQETIKLLKSLGVQFTNLKDRLFKSAGDGAVDGGVEAADEFETIQDEAGEDGYFDAAPMLVALQKGMTGLTQVVEQKVAYDHERDQQMAKGFEAIASLYEVQNAAIEVLRKSVTITSGDKEIPLTVAMMAVLKSRPGAPIDIANLAMASEGTGDGVGSGRPEGVPATFEALQKSLTAGKDADKITGKEMAIAENAFRGREYETLMPILGKCKV